MGGFSEILSFVGALIGLFTVLLPIVAKWMDRKSRRERREAAHHQTTPPTPPPVANTGASNTAPPPLLQAPPKNAPHAPPPVAPYTPSYTGSYAPPQAPAYYNYIAADPQTRERAKNLVFLPAVLMIVMGVLGLGFNLFVAAFGFINDFVTPPENRGTVVAPVDDRSIDRTQTPEPSSDNRFSTGSSSNIEDPQAAAMAIMMLLCFAAASAVAIWAGVSMIRLRSYWLSLAGSLAIMPGACFCFLLGFPVGIYAFIVLMRPDVRSSFW